MHVGDLVRLPPGGGGASPALGLVRQISRARGGAAATCCVVPLAADVQCAASRASAGIVVPAESVELAEGLDDDSGPQPKVVKEFEEESKFSELIFQPGGVKPLSDALRRRQCKICVLGGSFHFKKRATA